MPDEINTGGGPSVHGDVRSRDFTGRDVDGRQQNLSVQFAPTDATIRQPGVVYTIQEVLAQVNEKLDRLGEQMSAIRAEQQSMKFEQTALKREVDEIKQEMSKQETSQQQVMLFIFRFLTLMALVAIIVLLLRLGAL